MKQKDRTGQDNAKPCGRRIEKEKQDSGKEEAKDLCAGTAGNRGGEYRSRSAHEYLYQRDSFRR
jgi:hypothetical protein